MEQQQQNDLRKKNEFRVEKQALDNWHRRYTQRDFWDSNHGVCMVAIVVLLLQLILNFNVSMLCDIFTPCEGVLLKLLL